MIEIIEELELNSTDKHTVHSYIENFYQIFFKKFENKEKKILEIGSREGDSLKLWEKALPKSEVFGIDNNKSKKFKKINSKRIKVILGNAYQKEIINSLPNFDIIIDDGPHSLESQIKCLELYFPKLNNNGVIVIEDIQKYENIKILKKTYKKLGGFKIKEYDFRKIKNRYDDVIVTFKKFKYL